MMADIPKADSGRIKIDGIDIAEKSIEAKKQFGYVPDSPDQLLRAIALLPLFYFEAVALWNTYETIASNCLTGTLLAALLTDACLAIILFGILYVISTYYFADDTVLLLYPI